jgi:hypothetical protein
LDPDETLKRALALATGLLATIDAGAGWGGLQETEVDDLCTALLALDRWMQSGGIIPSRWMANRLPSPPKVPQ